MQVALHTIFAASRKEPLADVVKRIHAAILAAGFGEPFLQFIMADSLVPGGVSSLDRALKRFPQLDRFVHDQALPGSPDRRVISNGDSSGAAGEALDFATLVEIARGVPRSLPFHNITLQIRSPALGPEVASPFPLGLMPGGLKPAIMVTDSWWVNGRQRSVSALTIIDAESSAKKLPALPPGVAAVFAACGKARKTDQIPLAPPLPGSEAAAAPAAIIAVQRDFRARLAEIVEQAGLPHDLPPTREAITARSALSPARKSRPWSKNSCRSATAAAATPAPLRCAGGRRKISLSSCLSMLAPGATR